MKRLAVAAVAAFLLSLSWATAASLLSERQARAKAIAILMGDPYGTTSAQVEGNIKDALLKRDGKTKACGATDSEAWEFHIVVVTPNKDQFNEGVIDGYLALDARIGEMLCANLPLLD